MHLRALLGLTLALAACGSTPTEPEPVAPEIIDIQRPWPQDFMDAGLLVADYVAIEGPRGLLEHVALSQDDTLLEYKVETLPEGFSQSLTRKPEVNYAELRAALDALTITAFRRVTVLERPGDVPLRITARGAVWFRGYPPASLIAVGHPAGELVELRADELVLSAD